jgi:hypothetical protein
MGAPAPGVLVAPRTARMPLAPRAVLVAPRASRVSRFVMTSIGGRRSGAASNQFTEVPGSHPRPLVGCLTMAPSKLL